MTGRRSGTATAVIVSRVSEGC